MQNWKLLLACASAWALGGSPWRALQAVHEFPVQLNGYVLVALDDLQLHLLESGVVSWSRSSSRQTLTGSCHFSHLNFAARAAALFPSVCALEAGF